MQKVELSPHQEWLWYLFLRVTPTHHQEWTAVKCCLNSNNFTTIFFWKMSLTIKRNTLLWIADQGDVERTYFSVECHQCNMDRNTSLLGAILVLGQNWTTKFTNIINWNSLLVLQGAAALGRVMRWWLMVASEGKRGVSIDALGK